MNKQIEALKMAIEWMKDEPNLDYQFYLDTINACKEALAEAEKQEWKSLSDDEMLKLYENNEKVILDDFIYFKHNFARAIEQALKEKNDG